MTKSGLYHYYPPLERLTSYFVYDPLKPFNVFGWSICGLTANLLAVLFRRADFQDARIINLKGHEATELFYGGEWHLFDGDLKAFQRRLLLATIKSQPAKTALQTPPS